MKKLLIIIFTIAFSLCTQAQTATQPSGDGSKNNPYQIATLENLYWLSQSESIWNDSLHFVQTAEIDASDSKNWNSGKGFSPIGNADSVFNGHYNGKGHFISGMQCFYQTKREIGLFGRAHNASIDSVGINQSGILGVSQVGGIAGVVTASTSIRYCRVLNSNIMSLSTTGVSEVGALIGFCYKSSISYSYTTGCEVYGTKDNVGGLVGGLNSSALSNCYSNSDATSGNKSAGGLVGWAFYNGISNCYALGDVYAIENSGGLIGINRYGYVENCYASNYFNGDSYVQPTIGNQTDGVLNSYYNSDITSYSDSSAIPLTSDEMKESSNYNNWDFDTVWGIRPDSTWPALLNVNNAPLAFKDSITGKVSINLSELLANDFDYETEQSQLICSLKYFTQSYGTLTEGTYTFNRGISAGEYELIEYRVGEILTNGDTLLGNEVWSSIYCPNFAPEIGSEAPSSIASGEEYVYAIVASDYNGDELSYTLTNAPSGMTISDTIIKWTPAEGTITSGDVTLTVSDGSLTATENFSIVISTGNSAPVITSTATTTATIGIAYTYTVVATDTDGDNLTFKLSNAPAGMSISDNVITWTPTAETTTSGEITLTVSDGSLTATETFTITVSGNGGTDVDDITNESILLYPNPVSDVLTIISNSNIESLQLLSVAGVVQNIAIINSTTIQLDMHGYKSGIYIVKVQVGNKTLVKRIIKD